MLLVNLFFNQNHQVAKITNVKRKIKTAL